MRKRGYLQISFAWLFAIIAGLIILALAIFLVTKIIGVGESGIDAETATKIGVLLNPLETGFEDVKAVQPMTFPSDTRLHNNCDARGTFGTQKISVTQKSFGKWTDANLNVSFMNKYIFSEKIVEGKKLFLFSAPFEYPFKVGNVIVIYPESERYCFRNPPRDVENEMSNLEDRNIEVVNCSQGSKKICFGAGGDCEISVMDYDEDARTGYVQKGEDRLYFASGLFYGAIFSDKRVYDCQLSRLMKRASELASIYQGKASLIAQKDCNTNVGQELGLLGSALNGVTSSSELPSKNALVEEIGRKNSDNSRCKLW